MKKAVNGAASILAVGLSIASVAQADGFYYGASLGYTQMTSTTDGIGETSGETAVFGGILGYRTDLTKGQFLSAELNLDFAVDGEMSYSNGADSCSSQSPDWCDIDALGRIRGVYGLPVGSGYDFIASAGLAIASGVAEDGPGVYVDTVGVGYTVGIGAQRQFSAGMTGRIEIIYDSIGNTDPDEFDKTLENIGLVTSLVF